MDSIIIFCAQYLFLSIGLLILWVAYKIKRQDQMRLAITILLSGVAGYVLAKIASNLYYDPRPFVKSAVTPLISHSADNAFPSDHSWFSAFLAMALYKYNKQLGRIALIIAVVVGSARVFAHVHSPIDIIAGLGIGILAGYLGYFATVKLAASGKIKTLAK